MLHRGGAGLFRPGQMIMPAAMVASGPPGSPISWFDFTDPSTLKQNSNGTGDVGDGDPIGYAADQSGNDYNVTQTGASTVKPTYQAAKGAAYFDDGDWLWDGGDRVAGDFPRSYAAVVELDTPGFIGTYSWGTIAGHSGNGGSSHQIVNTFGTAGENVQPAGAATVVTVPSPTETITNKRRALLVVNASRVPSLYIDGAAVTLASTPAAGNADNANAQPVVGSQYFNSASISWLGWIYGAVFWDSDQSANAAEIDAFLQRWE